MCSANISFCKGRIKDYAYCFEGQGVTSCKEDKRNLWRLIMLRNSDDLRKFQLSARDGDIGHVDDLLFHDDRWNVRYLVVNTNRWLPGRKVLLIPDVLGPPDVETTRLPTDLTKDQVKDSPDIDTDKPVSRQKEIDLFEYYGWSPYWGGGHGGFTQPVMAEVTPEEQELSGATPPGDPHLRSMREVDGYAIQARDGLIGHVEDLLVDDVEWVIRYLIVDTRNWLPGRKVVVGPTWVERVNWQDRTVRVDLSRDDVKQSPLYDPTHPFDREEEIRIHDHYGRPYYWESAAESRM